MKKVFLMYGALCALLPLAAKDFFVSPKGNDKNPGTEQAPWKTIAFAAQKANPGDTVKIAPGLYREQIVFKRSGKKGAPITFEGTRGKDGAFLTIVEGVGTNLTKWVKAPEIAPDVWKTDLKQRPDLMMMDGKMIVYINKSTTRFYGMTFIANNILYRAFFEGRYQRCVVVQYSERAFCAGQRYRCDLAAEERCFRRYYFEFHNNY